MNAPNAVKSNQMKRAAMPDRIDMSRGGRSLATLAPVILAVALGLANTASAEVYGFMTGPAKNTSLFADNNSCWTNSAGVAAGSLASSDVLHFHSGSSCSLTANSTFGGEFHFGAENGSGSTAVIRLIGYTLTLSDLLWHNGTFQIYNGSKVGILDGSATLDNPSATHTLGTIASSGGALIVQSDLTCSESSLAVKISTSANANSYIVIAGDNSAYQGYFDQSTHTAPLIVAHANALGSPSVSRTGALSINVANVVFSVLNGVTPNAARGIEINMDGFRICATNYTMLTRAAAYADCSEFELPMPITGAYGFTKNGDGTVRLSGDYTAGDIVVANGTLVIASSANFPAGQKISVASGAALYVHQALSGFDITAAEGATVEYVLDTFEVAYNDSMRTATALVRGSSFSIPDGVKQPISLSSAISLPLHTALHLEVLTVASGAATLSADDFTDGTHKTFGLPRTSFEVTTDGAGVQHVYLNVRPVVVSVATFSSTGNDSLNTSSESWSNGEVAQSDYDYLVTNLVARIPNTVFAGGSLTFANAGSAKLEEYSRSNGALDATLYPGTAGIRIVQNNSNGHGEFTIGGNICIAGDYDDNVYVEFAAKYGVDDGHSNCWHRLSANLSGEGPLMMSSTTKNGPKGNPQLWGDNSAFKGRIYVTYTGSGSGAGNAVEEWNHVAMTFNSAAALGGALDTFKYDSLKLDKWSALRPAESITFSTENRGIYGSGPFGFDVQDGITFKVGVPVKMDNVMFKHGEGDLILGGTISYGASSTKTCYVREGGIGALNDAAVAELDVVFSNATKIVIAPGATLVNGFTGNLSFEPANAKVSVGVADDFPPLDIDEGFQAVIATVPVSEGDLSSRFTVERMKGFTGTVVTESVTIGETPCTRYSVKYTRTATTILIR